MNVRFKPKSPAKGRLKQLNMLRLATLGTFLWLAFQSIPLSAQDEPPIIDSAMSFAQAIAGTKAPAAVLNNLVLIEVEYHSFDQRIHRGQLVLHKDRVSDIKEAFKRMLQEDFPIEKCIPIVSYNWSDDASMADNNTSMFNYRTIAGRNTLSNHAMGLAIDINPRQNPAVYADGRVSPPGARYQPNSKGTLTSRSIVTRFLQAKGWNWGGDFTHVKDWQHFDRIHE